MPRYIIERNVGSLTPEEWDAAGRKSNEVLAQMDGVVWIRSYISHAEGKVYCEYDAPSKESVIEHARLAGLPVDRVSEISLEISPTMFM
jgi:hypothetical protein